jgi:hypothetical protein
MNIAATVTLLLATALPAAATQPHGIDWTEVVASGEGVRAIYHPASIAG